VCRSLERQALDVDLAEPKGRTLAQIAAQHGFAKAAIITHVRHSSAGFHALLDEANEKIGGDLLEQWLVMIEDSDEIRNRMVELAAKADDPVAALEKAGKLLEARADFVKEVERILKAETTVKARRGEAAPRPTPKVSDEQVARMVDDFLATRPTGTS